MGVFCDVCQMLLSSEIVMRDHVKGKKHLRLAQTLMRQKQQCERSIYLRGFSRGTTEATLCKYFRTFGSIKKSFLEKEHGLYAFIEFASRDAVLKVLEKPDGHFIGSKSLIVKQRELKKFVPKKKPKHKEDTIKHREPILFHKLICERLHQERDVASQIICLQKALQLTQDDMEERRLIKENLQQVFTEVFGVCTVHQFGSSANGLGTKSSDMDLFLDLQLDNNDQGTLAFIENIKSIQLTDGGSNRAALSDMPLHDLIRIVGRVLLNWSKRSHVIHTVITIPSARCPVVKFVHQPSGVHCDISINNRLALRNTKYIQLMQQYDSRIQPLLFVIRYWSKCREIAGNENSGPRLTGYALTMLVYFYLQQSDPPVLPSVNQIAKMAGMQDRVILEGWDCTFPQDASVIPQSDNTSSVSKLLYGFLKFYASFDFQNQIICPRSGQAVDIATFKAAILKDEKLKGFKFGPICIQDPFVLEHNTASNINDKVRQLIHMECQKGKIKMESEDIFYNRAEVKPWGLEYLFTKETNDIPLQSPVKTVVYTKAGGYSFPVAYFPAKLIGVPRFYEENISKETLKMKWMSEVCKLYLTVLSQVLLFDVNVLESKYEQMVSSEKTEENIESNKDDSNASSSGNAKQSTYKMSDLLQFKEVGDMCIGDVQMPQQEALIAEANSPIKRMSPGVDGKQPLKRCRCEGKVAGSIGNLTEAGSSSSEFMSVLEKISYGNYPSASKAPLEQGLHVLGPLLLSAECRTNKRTWNGRKKIRQRFRTEETAFLDLESKVSCHIASMSDNASLAVAFYTVLSVQESATDTQINITLKLTKGEKEFSNFYQFLKTFFTKAVDNCIYR